MSATQPESELPPSRTTPGPYRYARWDGTQRIDELTADDLMSQLSDDILADSDLSGALARLLARGLRGDRQEGRSLTGLHDLLGRLADAREELLSRYDLGDVLGEVRAELDEIVSSERRALERHIAGVARDRESDDPALQRLATDMASRRQAQLDQMPSDVGGRIRGLSDYDFLDQEARGPIRGAVGPTAQAGARFTVRRTVRRAPWRDARPAGGKPGHGARAELAAPGATCRSRT